MEATVLRRSPPLIIHPQEEANALVTLTPGDLSRKMSAISHFNYLQNRGGGWWGIKGFYLQRQESESRYCRRKD